MATYSVSSIFDQAGNEFKLHDDIGGVHKVDQLPGVADGKLGEVYLLSTDNKFYMLSDDKTEWISISYPADSALDAGSTNAIQNKVVTKALGDIEDSLDAHVEDKENPHEVTAEQVGAYTKEEITTILESFDLTDDALGREQELRDLIDSVAHGTNMVPFKEGDDIFMRILDYFATKPVPYAATFYSQDGVLTSKLTSVPQVLVADNKMSGFYIDAFCLYSLDHQGTEGSPNYHRSILLVYTNNNSDAGYIKFLGRIGNATDGRPSTPKNSYWEQFLNTSMCDGNFSYKSNKVATVATVTNKINALDVSDSAVANQFVTAVSETDGKVKITRRQPEIADIKGLQTTLSTESTARSTADETLSGRIDDLEKATADAIKKAHSHDADQIAAMNSGITGTKVEGYDTHISNTEIHVTSADKTAWSGKQDKLTNTDAEIQSAVSQAHTHGNLEELDKIETGDKAKWDAKQDALEFLTVTDVDTIWDGVTV